MRWRGGDGLLPVFVLCPERMKDEKWVVGGVGGAEKVMELRRRGIEDGLGRARRRLDRWQH